jgi:cytochrome c-type biogenesis protein
MELLLGYGAGLLTLINPCVLPVLPIVLASSLQAGKWGPVALASGMTLTFTVLGLTIAVIGRSFGLSDRLVTNSAAIAMLGFGLALVVPRLNAGFATATAGLAAQADQGMNAVAPDGLGGQFAGGALLGAVWSPCIGPTLGGAIALASQGGSLAAAGGVMLAFCAGVSSIMLMLAYGARSMLQRRRAAMQALAVRAKPIMGATFIIVAIAILSGLTQRIEGFAVTHLPFWLQDLSVSI